MPKGTPNKIPNPKATSTRNIESQTWPSNIGTKPRFTSPCARARTLSLKFGVTVPSAACLAYSPGRTSAIQSGMAIATTSPTGNHFHQNSGIPLKPPSASVLGLASFQKVATTSVGFGSHRPEPCSVHWVRDFTIPSPGKNRVSIVPSWPRA